MNDMKNETSRLKIRKIKFNLQKKNYRLVNCGDSYVYDSIDESDIHRIIITYCKENNINLKSIKIFCGTCVIKIYGNADNITTLVLYITKVFCGWIENLSY